MAEAERRLSHPDDETVVSLKRASGHRKKAEAVYRRIKVRTEDSDKKGARLLGVINRTMAKFGHSTEDVALEIGVSAVYLRAIAAGSHSFAKVDRDVLRKVAHYVRLPVAQVFLLSDTLNAEDFFYEDSMEKEIEMAYSSMSLHPMWAGYAPALDEWNEMSTRSQLCICMLYEKATGQSFLTATEVPEPEEK